MYCTSTCACASTHIARHHVLTYMYVIAQYCTCTITYIHVSTCVYLLHVQARVPFQAHHALSNYRSLLQKSPIKETIFCKRALSCTSSTFAYVFVDTCVYLVRVLKSMKETIFCKRAL